MGTICLSRETKGEMTNDVIRKGSVGDREKISITRILEGLYINTLR